jgi:hypothetical protein
MTTPTADTGTLVRRLRIAAHVVLAVVAVIGAALSYTSLQAAAADVFHQSPLAYGFPLLVDALILGASLQYVAGSRDHTPGRTGWRATAHAGIAATLLLNALAAFAPDGGGAAAVPWHITAPAVWAVLVELYARTAAGHWRTEHVGIGLTIPLRLWITAPVESARTWLRQARLTAAVTARYDVGRHAAALEALRLTLPGRPGRRVRTVLRRQLRAGSLTADNVLTACGWNHCATDPVPRDPQQVLRTALTSDLEARTVPAARVHSVPAVVLGCAEPTEYTSIRLPAPMYPERDEYTEGAGYAVPADLESEPNPGHGSITKPLADPLQPSESDAKSRPAEASDPPTSPPSADADDQIVASIITTGALPSVRAIKAGHRVGQARATRIRSQAATQLGNRPNPT